MRPVSTSTESELWTYQDIVEHLLDVFDSSRDGRPLRMAKRAANEALRELSSAHRWACYDETRLLTTVAVYDTGTITYDHTGGSAERLVTLTSGGVSGEFTGSIAELLGYEPDINSVGLSRLRSAIATKYGLTIA